MKKNYFITIIFLLTLFLFKNVYAKNNYFLEGKKLFLNKDFDESKFKFEKDIVFNPKNEKSYLYLAKIYLEEENEEKEEKNLNTSLLLDPNDEETIYMLINIKLKKSNFSKVKELTEKFELVCSILCNKTTSIKTRLNEIEAKDKS